MSTDLLHGFSINCIGFANTPQGYGAHDTQRYRELRRNDEAFLDGLGAQRIPDPTTSGDFTRRFDQGAIVD